MNTDSTIDQYVRIRTEGLFISDMVSIYRQSRAFLETTPGPSPKKPEYFFVPSPGDYVTSMTRNEFVAVAKQEFRDLTSPTLPREIAGMGAEAMLGFQIVLKQYDLETK
ncbi:hypothetical protein HYV86_03830 [Candidatus Woesearchaeota archaeon]|nr:hypothetical protein [Candidatus Woesearchaeota archaeon]